MENWEELVFFQHHIMIHHGCDTTMKKNKAASTLSWKVGGRFPIFGTIAENQEWVITFILLGVDYVHACECASVARPCIKIIPKHRTHHQLPPISLPFLMWTKMKVNSLYNIISCTCPYTHCGYHCIVVLFIHKNSNTLTLNCKIYMPINLKENVTVK